jgi:DNA ligase-associated metallophosphoesterase
VKRSGYAVATAEDRGALPWDAPQTPGRPAAPAAAISSAEAVRIAGTELLADASGALYWAEHRLLAIADLHLEKGSSFAERGSLVPPYDTEQTLSLLAAVIERYAPARVVALGDSFHDRRGGARLTAAHRAQLLELQQGREWIWITGNHDPDPIQDIGGTFAASLTMGPLVFRHISTPDGCDGEIAGHLHPVARIGPARRRCFISNEARLIMPAFGAYAGGLNVRHRAFAELFGIKEFTVHVIGRTRVYAIGAAYCLPD